MAAGEGEIAVPHDAAPLRSSEFATALEALGPFERRPHLAVAVSGGADSLCLCLFAVDWCRRYDGRVTALVVDHRMRPASAAEAAATVGRLAAIGVDHRVLVWDNAGGGRSHAAAREARYRLLIAACREAGALHLLTGHQADDVAETMLIRALSGSDRRGLAPPAAIVETPSVRILRPLLTFPAARLRAALAARGVDWIEDPGNVDPSFERARVRIASPSLTMAGLGRDHLAHVSGAMVEARRASEEAIVEWLACSFRWRREGWVETTASSLAQGAPDVRAGGLSRLLAVVGGGRWPPAAAAAAAVAHWASTALPGDRRCLARCVIARGEEGLAIFREARGLPAPASITLPLRRHWDRRFMIEAAGERDWAVLGAGLLLRAPHLDEARRIARNRAAAGLPRIPPAVIATSPTITRGEELPSLLFEESDLRPMASFGLRVERAEFCACYRLSGEQYFLL